MTDILFQPFVTPKLQLKNRVVFAAADGGSTGDAEGNLLDREIERYSRIAQGGAGLIETGCFGVHPHGVSNIATKAHLFSDHIIPSLQKLTDRIHKEGAKIAAQIYHYGAKAGSILKDKNIQAITASKIDHAYPYQNQDFINNYREATNDDLNEVIAAFGEAALKVKKSGFDAVVVHASHDTILSQFLSPATNKRTDKWGGSLENRVRLHLEVLKSIRKQVDDYFCVIIKLGVYEPFAEGLDFADGKQAAKLLHQAGYNIIEISQGQNGHNWEETCARQKINSPELEGYFRRYSQEIHAEGIPTILTGGLRSYEVITEIMQNNETDLVGLCRPLIRDPSLVSDWQNGNHRKSNCVSCNKCLLAIIKNLPLICITS